MFRQLTPCILVSAALAASFNEPGGQPRLTVFVYDFAETPPDILAKTKMEAAAVYKSIGVDIDWLTCSVSRSGAALAPGCNAFGPDRLEVRLLPESKTRLLNPAPSDLGRALLSDHDGFGTVAFVFADRAKGFGSSPDWAYGPVLGHIVAHELGHLLLGRGAHSLDGIMHTRWGSPEIVRSLQRQMLFTKQQSERIRAQVLARMAHSRAGD
jgi:hypothetical protein